MISDSGDNVPKDRQEIPEIVHPRMYEMYLQDRTHNEPTSRTVRSCVALCELHCPLHPNYQAKSDGDARVPTFRDQNENPSSAVDNPDVSITVSEEHITGFQTVSGPVSSSKDNVLPNPKANDKMDSGKNVPKDPQEIPEIAYQAPTSASGSGTHNDLEEPIQRWPIQRGGSEAGPSRPVRSCGSLCEVHCPLHPNYKAKVQSDIGISVSGDRHDNPLLDFLYDAPQNENANDKKPSEIVTASSSSEPYENHSSETSVNMSEEHATGSQTASGPESSSNDRKGFCFPWFNSCFRS